MSNNKYKIEVSRDLFAEAQPENTTGEEIYQVSIYDGDELIDCDTGYKTEDEAKQSGLGQIQRY